MNRVMLVGVGAGAICGAALGQTTLRVPSQYATIQLAIDAAAAGDTVLVAPGVYSGRAAQEIRFRGKAITVRSEAGAAATTLDNGRTGTVVVFDGAEPREAVLEGFTITGATRSGILVTQSSPTIRNCVIEDCWNGLFGGGVQVEQGADVRLIGCVIDRNLAGQGGAVNVWEGARATLEGCTLSNNRVDITGGAGLMADLGSEVTMIGCLVTGNQAIGFAGSSAGVRVARDSEGMLINCIVAGNTASGASGGVSFTNSGAGAVINCTIADNIAPSGGAGLLVTTTGPEVRIENTILWGNAPDAIRLDAGELTVRYSVVEFGWPGEGNQSENPLFVAPGSGDYALRDVSAAIDAGDNGAVPTGVLTDFAGAARFVDDPVAPDTGVAGGAGGARIVDVGALERQVDGCYADCDGSGALDFFDFLCFQNAFDAGCP